MSYWYDLLVYDAAIPSVLRFLIKSCLLWSSHQNRFKFATWISCIIRINICMIPSWYILWISVFWGVFSVFLLRKMWPEKKSLWLNHVTYEVLIRFTSNLLHCFIVSYLSICVCLQANIYYHFSAFLCFHHCFYLKMWPGKNVKVSD